jgi:hypothetical protein
MSFGRLARLVVTLGILVAAFPSAAAAQPTLWTLDDLQNGTLERIVGMDDQRAVAFYNRWRPRTPQPSSPEPSSQVLTSDPQPEIPAVCSPIPIAYFEPERAAACAAATRGATRPNTPQTFRKHVVYRDPVDELRNFVVIELTRDPAGREIVTVIWSTGAPGAFVNDARQQPWLEVGALAGAAVAR